MQGHHPMSHLYQLKRLALLIEVLRNECFTQVVWASCSLQSFLM